jgi:hypothetical protein
VHTVVTATGHSALRAGASYAEILFDLQLRFKDWLREHGLQCSTRRFTLSSIHRDKATLVCQFACKAAQAPLLTAWLQSLSASFSEHCPAACKAEADLVSVCLWGLSTYFAVLKSGDRFLTQSEADLLGRAGLTLLLSYSELARLSGGAYLWHIVPKFHMFQHLYEDAQGDKYNPRFFTCFGDEDLTGKLLRIARTGHSTTVVDHAVGVFVVGLKQRFEALR